MRLRSRTRILFDSTHTRTHGRTHAHTHTHLLKHVLAMILMSGRHRAAVGDVESIPRETGRRTMKYRDGKREAQRKRID